LDEGKRGKEGDPGGRKRNKENIRNQRLIPLGSKRGERKKVTLRMRGRCSAVKRGVNLESKHKLSKTTSRKPTHISAGRGISSYREIRRKGGKGPKPEEKVQFKQKALCYRRGKPSRKKKAKLDVEGIR